MLFSLSFDSTSENLEFSWPITGLILKALKSLLLSFLLSAKYRFWRTPEKRFPIIVLNTIITNRIIFSPVFSYQG